MGSLLRLSWVVAAVLVQMAPSDDRRLVPGERAGAVTATSGKDELISTFGAELVQDRPFYVGEGFCVPGVVIFEGTSDEIEIAWREGTSAVALVRVMQAGGRWRTAEGVRVGTTLAELEALNGAPFSFSGFGWDYGGGVGGWSGGRLDETIGGGMLLRLDAENGAVERLSREGPVDELFGERLVRSDSALARRARVRVTMMEVLLGPLPESKFCG